MIEVMISVAILSFSMLGIAMLQAKSADFNHTAFLRSIALAQATSMVDRMRANAPATNTQVFSGFDFSNKVSTPNCTVCSSTDRAAKDIAEWQQATSDYLPSGRGLITFDAASNTYSVQVMWDGTKSGATGTGCSNNTSIDLSCVRINLRL